MVDIHLFWTSLILKSQTSNFVFIGDIGSSVEWFCLNVWVLYTSCVQEHKQRDEPYVHQNCDIYSNHTHISIQTWRPTSDTFSPESDRRKYRKHSKRHNIALSRVLSSNKYLVSSDDGRFSFARQLISKDRLVKLLTLSRDVISSWVGIHLGTCAPKSRVCFTISYLKLNSISSYFISTI